MAEQIGGAHRRVAFLAGEADDGGGDLFGYTLLHTAGRIVRGQRRRKLRIPQTWPWADALRAAFARVLALPAPT